MLISVIQIAVVLSPFLTGGKVLMISTQVKVTKHEADKCMLISMCTKGL